MLRASSCLVLLGLGLAACVVPPSSAARLTESAYDLNTAARFGRMDLALENVKDSARDEFAQRHAGWGRTVRIVDYDFGGVSMRKDGDAEVRVTVNWQRPDEATMRTTEIVQRWTEKRGTWWMLSEEERGDRGLLAEAPKPADATAKSPDAAAKATDAATPQNESAPAPAAGTPAQAARSRYQTRTIYEQ